VTNINPLKNRTKMENLIKFEQRAQAERETLGTVSSIAGKGATISFIKNNFLNPDKRLYIVIKRPDGASASFTCSPNVGNGVRDKSISVSQLAGFPICEAVSQDGEVFAQIQMPNGQGLVEAGSLDVVTEFVPEKFDPSDLVKF
jgi:hypothetical protein